MAAYGTLTRDLLETYAGGEPLDERPTPSIPTPSWACWVRKSSQTKRSSTAACRAWTTACGACESDGPAGFLYGFPGRVFEVRYWQQGELQRGRGGRD
jgi:hypothetical protein